MVAEIVGRSEDMAADNPDEALEFVWNALDSRFKSHSVAAEKLLMELQQFPLVSSDDPNNLWNFSLACKQANMLMDTEQGRELTILNLPKTQQLVTGRLSSALWDKWSSHAFKYNTR